MDIPCVEGRLAPHRPGIEQQQAYIIASILPIPFSIIIIVEVEKKAFVGAHVVECANEQYGEAVEHKVHRKSTPRCIASAQ
jgi:hypothetical protein